MNTILKTVCVKLGMRNLNLKIFLMLSYNLWIHVLWREERIMQRFWDHINLNSIQSFFFIFKIVVYRIYEWKSELLWNKSRSPLGYFFSFISKTFSLSIKNILHVLSINSELLLVIYTYLRNPISYKRRKN